MGEALWLRVANREMLEREHAQNLVHGRAFVPDATGLSLFSECELVIVHPTSGATFAVDCHVVMVMEAGPMKGIALQFNDRSERLTAALAEFVAGGADREGNDALERAQRELERGLAFELPCSEHEAFAEQAHEPGDSDLGETNGDGGMQTSEAIDADEPDADAGGDEDDDDGVGVRSEYTSERPLRTSHPPAFVTERQQRLRNLSINDRLKVARGSIMEDRIQLERIYGANVWEPLLHNPKITVAEVARIAKKGTIPRPLIELIVENESWIRQGIVRRALLTNPRLSMDSALKVLRTMPARELKLVPQQTAYPSTVRAAATRLMRGS